MDRFKREETYIIDECCYSFLGGVKIDVVGLEAFPLLFALSSALRGDTMAASGEIEWHIYSAHCSKSFGYIMS